MGVTYPCANSRIWRRNISTTSSSRTCLVCLRKSRTPLPASTLTQSVVGWPHTQGWPSSWGSPGRSPSALRWRPSSSGVSAGQGTTRTWPSETSHSPGPLASLSALIHNFFPNAFDFNALRFDTKEDRLKNYELAFMTGEKFAGVPDFPTAEDMAGMVEEQRIDPKMIFSYVQEVYRMCNEL